MEMIITSLLSFILFCSPFFSLKSYSFLQTERERKKERERKGNNSYFWIQKKVFSFSTRQLPCHSLFFLSFFSVSLSSLSLSFFLFSPSNREREREEERKKEEKKEKMMKLVMTFCLLKRQIDREKNYNQQKKLAVTS